MQDLHALAESIFVLQYRAITAGDNRLQGFSSSTRPPSANSSIPKTLVKNKSIGIYDGAYKSVELATGKPFQR